MSKLSKILLWFLDKTKIMADDRKVKRELAVGSFFLTAGSILTIVGD